MAQKTGWLPISKIKAGGTYRSSEIPSNGMEWRQHLEASKKKPRKNALFSTAVVELHENDMVTVATPACWA